MSSDKLYTFLVATANMIKSHNSDAAFVLNALAGSVGCHDVSELRKVVQEWARKKIEATPDA